MKKKLLLLLSSILFFMPLYTISCIRNNFNSNKSYYVERNNYANDYGDFSYLKDNFFSDNVRNINLATSAKLLRIKSEKQPLIDFRDNIVIFPSSIYYVFEWANKISLTSKLNKKYEFNNDQIDKVQYNPKNNDEEKGIFKPKKDKGKGFNSPFLTILSSNENSINNHNFKELLKETKSIEIFVNESKNVWLDWNGTIIKDNNLLNANSFKLGIFANLLKNKIYRETYAKLNNINLKNIELNNKIFKGFDLYQFLVNNKINVNKLVDFSSNKLILETIDNSFIDFNYIFENLFIVQNYFDALPYEIIKAKYGDPTTNFDWLFKYGKTYRDRYYASFYYINSSTSNEIILNKNDNYIKKSNDSLAKIKIEYSPLQISQNNFSSQTTNAFKQNIISKINYEELSLDDKNKILKNFKKYNFSYEKNFNRFKINTNIIINHSPEIKSPYMNEYFMELFYGLEDNSNFNLKPKNIIFQSLFNNIINQYSLTNENKDIWLSQAPQNLLLIAKNKGINYEDLKDAFVNISKPIIISQNFSKINDTFQFQNKQKLSDPKIIDITKKTESYWFLKIKTELKKIIDNFYVKKNKKKNIYINIPILIKYENQFISNRIKIIKKIMNSIHKNLEVDLTIIDNHEKYNEFFRSNKSIYKHNEIKIYEGNSIEYLSTILTDKDNYILNLIKLLKQNEFNKKNLYNELIDYQNFIDNQGIKNHNINLQFNLLKIKKYIGELTIEKQLNLLNEINNLLSYTLNFDNQINISSFSKVIYQKHLIKSLSPNNLNYLQDIKIGGK